MSKTGDGRATRPFFEKTFCEFFAGIGLVGEGLAASGWKCVYANDIDAGKQELYKARNGNVEHYHLEDVRRTDRIKPNIPGRPFLATASFPCIDLSLAGRYRGLKGRHSSTFFAFIAVLESLASRRPKAVLVENVPGFLTSREGSDFAEAAKALADLGYWLDAFVLDASRFVPQSRKRVLLVGLRKDARLPQAATLFADDPPSSKGWERSASLVNLMNTTTLPTGWLGLQLPQPPPRRRTLRDVLDCGDDQEWWDRSEVDRHYKMMSDRHRGKVDLLLAAKDKRVGTSFRRVRQGVQRMEVRFDGVAGCLRTPSGGSARQIVVMTDDGRLRMRWMSPPEYARLQGVDDFPMAGRRNQMLWAFGDAVCVPVIRWIDKHVLTPAYEHATGKTVLGRKDLKT